VHALHIWRARGWIASSWLWAWITSRSGQELPLWCRLLEEGLISLVVVLNRNIHRRIRLLSAKDTGKEALPFRRRLLLLLMVIILLLALEEALDVSTKLVGHDLELVCMKRSGAVGAQRRYGTR